MIITTLVVFEQTCCFNSSLLLIVFNFVYPFGLSSIIYHNIITGEQDIGYHTGCRRATRSMYSRIRSIEVLF